MRLRLSFLLLGLALAGRGARTQQIKEWRFPVRHGELRIALEHGPGDRLELDVLGPPCVPCASLKEVSAALGEVVRQMEEMKLDPARVHVIATQIDEPEVRDGLAAAALRSKDWERCMRIAACGGNEILVDLLNGTKAYHSFGEAWQKLGSTVRVVSAEKVSVERAGLVKGWVMPAGTNAKLQVPVNAHLLIEIVKAR